MNPKLRRSLGVFLCVLPVLLVVTVVSIREGVALAAITLAAVAVIAACLWAGVRLLDP